MLAWIRSRPRTSPNGKIEKLDTDWGARRGRGSAYRAERLSYAVLAATYRWLFDSGLRLYRGSRVLSLDAATHHWLPTENGISLNYG